MSDLQGRVAAEVQAQVEAASFRVPLLPQVASQVIALASQPDVDASKLSALIHRDPALAGQILRIANSAAYAPRMPIVSLQQAVARLGLRVISEIAFAASLQSGVFKVPGHEADLQKLWRHALASGTWGKEVARVRRTNVESAFLCGLLHGVGKPALLQLAVDVANRLKITLHRDWLPGLYQQHQRKVGKRLAEVWALPGAVAAAIVHQDSYCEAGAFANDAMTTALASLLATWSIDPEASPEALREHAVFADLNLYPEDVEALLSKRATVLAVVDALTV
jgi:HD-like signal output (HDOD) protein